MSFRPTAEREAHGERRLRWRPGMGCVGAAVLLLVGLVLGGHMVLEKGVRLVVERGAARLVELLPPDMPEAERGRVEEELHRWCHELPRGPGGERAAGRFLNLVQKIVDDGRMDHEELSRLQKFLADGGAQ